MKNSKYNNTNDHRLINHLQKISGIRSEDCTLDSIRYDIDMQMDWPLVLSSALVVYETFPVFGEFMFPKSKSLLWQLLDTTDDCMILTDAMVQGVESIYVAQPMGSAVQASGFVADLLRVSAGACLCVNTYKNQTAVLINLKSLRV